MKKLNKEWVIQNKKKVAVIGLVSFAALSGLGVTAYAMSKDNSKVQFANEKSELVEYGKKYETTCKAYLKDGKEPENCKVVVDGENEKDKEYLAVGEYTLKITWGEEELSKKLEVKDTTKPEFEDFKKEITIAEGSKDVNLADYFKAKDLSDVKVSVSGKVDYNKVGSYDIKVKAEDKYKNVSEEKSSVVIVASKEDIEEGKVEVSTPVTKTENGKQVVVSESKSGASEAKGIQDIEEESKDSSNEGSSSNNDGNSESSSSSNNSGNGGSSSAVVPTPQPEPAPAPAPQPTPEPAPAPQPPVCTVPDDSHVWSNNSGIVFGSDPEADAWARQQVTYGSGSQWENCSYTVFPMGCNGNGSPQYGVFFRVLIDR